MCTLAKSTVPVDPLLQRISAFIKLHTLFSGEDRILVAISGGPDSVMLAYALRELGYETGLAHVNYQARGQDSAQEEALIRQYADQWKIPAHVNRCDLKELTAASPDSFQVVARELRYTFFEEIRTQHGYTHCATAHHANDQLESALMSLIQGNSPSVFKEIPLRRGPYVRPLASLWKEEIVDFLDTHQLPYSIDYTNRENNYLRNRIRNQVLPLLAELNPAIQAQLAGRLAWYRLQHDFVTACLAPWQDGAFRNESGEAALDWTAFAQVHPQFVPLLIARWLEQQGIHGHALWAAAALRHSQPGKVVETEKGTVVRTREGLQLLHAEQAGSEAVLVERFEGEKMIAFREKTLRMRMMAVPAKLPDTPGIFFLDADHISWPLVLRRWQQGDKMQPFGMRGQKKLSDIFIDEKYDPAQKRDAIVITDQQQIVALSGFRIAEGVKIQPGARQVLEIDLNGAG